MTSFLKTILILLLVYYGLKLIFSVAKPYIFRFLAKKVNEKFESSFGQNPFEGFQQDKSSDSYQAKPKSSEPTSKKVVGEYIDFEEID
jgi:Domain of unknown function (DUF4834)